MIFRLNTFRRPFILALCSKVISLFWLPFLVSSKKGSNFCQIPARPPTSSVTSDERAHL